MSHPNWLAKFRVVLHKGPDGYVARYPAFVGCVSQGRTREEALAAIRAAIEGTVFVLNRRARKRSPLDLLVEVVV